MMRLLQQVVHYNTHACSYLVSRGQVLPTGKESGDSLNINSCYTARILRPNQIADSWLRHI